MIGCAVMIAGFLLAMYSVMRGLSYPWPKDAGSYFWVGTAVIFLGVILAVWGIVSHDQKR